MNRCSAPCVGYISENDYAKDVKNAINFLSGDTKKIIKDLNKNMDEYSIKEDYERAIIYRDKITAIRDTQKKQNVLTGFKDLDVFVIKKNKYNCCISVLKVEEGWINSSQNFYPDIKESISQENLLSIFIERYVIENKDKHKLNLLTDREIREETKDFLKKLTKPNIKIHKLNKTNKNLLEICNSQAEDALKRNSSFIWVSQSFDALSFFLNIKKINRIEAFDVSHTSGNQVSASCVVLNREGLDKKNYRLMNIKTEVNNDYLALSEAIKRRLKNLEKSKLNLPEVILLDGGKGQLNVVLKDLDEKLIKKIIFLSISKGPNRKEKYDFLHFNKKSFELKKLKNISKLIQLLRNESHRFAIKQHRKRRNRNFLASNLDDIEGIGSKLKINLIRHFGSAAKVFEASIDELSLVEGIGSSKGKKIHASINKYK